jgi:hypothetical protein
MFLIHSGVTLTLAAIVFAGILAAWSKSGNTSERPSVGCLHRPDAHWFADALEVALAAVFEADT